MKKTTFLLVVIFWTLVSATAVQAQLYNLKSPDNSIELTVIIENDIHYSIKVDGKDVLDYSRISLTVDDKVLGKLPVVVQVIRDEHHEILKPVVAVKSAEIIDNYRSVDFVFKEKFRIEFRAYNEGVAYRFKTNFKNDIKIKSEEADFSFPNDFMTYFPEETSFHSHNERYYKNYKISEITEEKFCSLPMLAEAENGVKLVITESDLSDYPGMWLKPSNGKFELSGIFPAYPKKVVQENDRSVKVVEREDYLAITKGKRTFPWRIVAIAKSDADLITNQLTYILAKPSQIEDPSWIKPGKVAWDWWNFNNVYGVDFNAGVNTLTYKYYIDFAAEYGIEYIIMDEGWYVLGDLTKIVPEINMDEITSYAKSKGVGVILWVVWKTLDDQLEESLAQFDKWGIKGIKVDFMQRDDQWMVNYYERIARAAAEHHLLVDFHGSYKPSGLQRTYPNALTREGVKGMENTKWTDAQSPTHDVTIPFIRMLAGPMDYTPGAMINAQQKNFHISWNRPMSMGTRCHQMAMYVVFESPLQMLADNPSNYIKEDECTRFISKIPTVWDETIVLKAKIGEVITIARRNGNDWYIGAMSNLDPRSIQVDFSFLPEGKYKIQIFQDGKNAHRYASDYKTLNGFVSKDDLFTIELAPGGGWAAILTPVDK
ncbi:MAG: alpha-glucosidase [Bacteroidetes bacterium HGW-Bacteroidetes-17]|jgi:alpha-glucosidase|nr:MAG: alpha-glucosidase [Bacteroidetes bacterium HGW-Bacteroidetes-17]